MTTINRDKLIAEELIRTHVRRKISAKILAKNIAEQKIRKVVRKLLETATGADESSKSTGINVLANLLEKIVPILEDDYKMLTTSDQQRESFRNHIVQAVKNALKPIAATDDAEDSVAENVVFDIDADLLSEKLKIDLDASDDDESVEGEFIDIDAGEEEDTFGSDLDGQNETGRNFAATSFKKVENQIVDAYDMLADDEDKDVFYDYLLTNLLLYFDKFEDELSPDSATSTTPEYEEEVEAEEEETEASVDSEEPLETAEI
jgi:hypothetical protein|tara:strand:+ start:10205 stop:10990 length:786 start_codon:yes stop_codon:yes gene_type:complete